MESEGEKVIEFIRTERSSMSKSFANNVLSINEATNNLIPDDIFKFNKFISCFSSFNHSVYF